MSERKKKYALMSAPLGIGGQAEVYQARNKETGQIVALKRVLRNDEEYVARLRREIEVQGALKHRNVMPLLDSSASYHWYTMPLADEVVGKLSTPINDEDLTEIVEACVAGLAEAHSHGFIHRDLTPNNILRLNDENGKRWVISDWGLVRTHGRTTIVRTAPNQSFGTAGFAAPELWDDAHSADARSDIYSLGRVVAWAVTGQWPKPNIPLVPNGPWQEFVRKTTTLEAEDRIQDLDAVVRLLSPINCPAPAPPTSVQPIRITRIITEGVTAPRNDGTRGSALYAIPFQLSRRPSAEWAELFVETWDHPPRWTTMHRSRIASVSEDKVVLDGTTIEEFEKYHRETLLLVIDTVNQIVESREQARLQAAERERELFRKHNENVAAAANRIRFDE